MERSVSGLAFKGSITQAIVEAKNQKKVFVVYLSGADADSAELEKSTWSDLKVAESVSKYCILLHIKEGSSDAANFSAIYPQSSVPSIAAIGHNGVQVWQSGGFVNAEVLASSLQKAWLSIQIQENAATVLTAALASKKYEPSTSESSGIDSSEHGNSVDAVAPSSSTHEQIQSSEAKPPVDSEMVKANNSDGHSTKENDSISDGKSASESSNSDKLDGKTVAESSTSGKLQSLENESPAHPTEEASVLLPGNLMEDPDYTVTDHLASVTEIGSLSKDKNVDHRSGFTGGDSQSLTEEIDEAVQEVKAELADVGKPDPLINDVRENGSSDVHLNIRLADGVSLQEKFSVTSDLRMVKDYVDKNQASMGSYDLAIPYPRKVFTDEDLGKSLSELGLFNRQALIVVPRQRATIFHRGGSSSSSQTTSRTNMDSSNANGGGYFSHIRRILSFINPLSYLGGGATSQSQTGMWEYDANPALQNNLARTGGAPSSNNSPNESSGYTTGRIDSRSRQNPSRFGSNIHTLKHDEDDRFNDRNSYWNGNSTQFGGNDDRRQG